MFSVALTFHVLATVVWIGGMFFAYCLLRPALQSITGTIDDSQRLSIWAATFKKFIPWVWLCIVVLLASGFYMIYLLGGFSVVGKHVYLMLAIAVVMIVIFKFIQVAPFQHLCRGVETEKWEVAKYALATIRKLVAVNLSLGILVIVIAISLSGKF